MLELETAISPFKQFIGNHALDIVPEPLSGGVVLEYWLGKIAEKEPVYGLWTHSRDVATLSLVLAIASGLPLDKQLNAVRAGLLHDLGKIKLPDSLFLKKDLNPNEWQMVKSHLIIGCSLIHWDFPTEKRIILTSHSMQNNPYPFWSRLSNDEQVLRNLQMNLIIADQTSALLENPNNPEKGRYYRPVFTPEKVHDELCRFGHDTKLIELSIQTYLNLKSNQLES